MVVRITTSRILCTVDLSYQGKNCSNSVLNIDRNAASYFIYSEVCTSRSNLYEENWGKKTSRDGGPESGGLFSLTDVSGKKPNRPRLSASGMREEAGR